MLNKYSPFTKRSKDNMSINSLIKSTESELGYTRNIRKMAMNQIHLAQVVVDQSLKEDRQLRGHLRALVSTRNVQSATIEQAKNLNSATEAVKEFGITVEENLGKTKPQKKHYLLRFKANAPRKVKGFPLYGVQRAIYEVHHNLGNTKLSFKEYVSVLKDHMKRTIYLII